MTAEWFRSYTTEWEVHPIRYKSWTQRAAIGGVNSFQLNTNGDDDVPLLQSGSIELDRETGELSSGWYRVIGRVIFPGGGIRYYPLFTMLFESDTFNYDYGINNMTMTGKSVLYPASTTHMSSGEYIPKGYSGARWCQTALMKCTPAPVAILKDKDFKLKRNYVFDSGTSYLEAVWEMLDAANWVIQINALGVILLRPKPKTAEVVFDKDMLAIFQPGITHTKNISEIHNVYFAEYNGRRAKAVNDDGDSPTSIAARGYIKDVIDTDPKMLAGETLEHYVNRKLEEDNTIIQTYTYTREAYGEIIQPFDMCYYNIPGIFTGNARILSQSFNATGGGIQVQEMCGAEVKLWTAK